ncbi:hypothetical protein [Kitasatospora sp. NPDC087271]|uniref:hypothetical protein n=1 Tax=Kitasatospora sp. NPDC087271 TaxID=3364067 RepID=UPI0038206967
MTTISEIAAGDAMLFPLALSYRKFGISRPFLSVSRQEGPGETLWVISCGILSLALSVILVFGRLGS